MGEQSSRCRQCGAPARVRILHGYDEAKPVIHSYCLECAETADEAASVSKRGFGNGFPVAPVLALCGVGLQAGAVALLRSGFDALLMLSAGALLLVGAMAFSARPNVPWRRRASAVR